MYGWRGRVGLIIAATNGVVEMESYRLIPDGVSVHFTRIPYAGTGTEEAENKMLSSLEASAKLLAGSSETLGVDVIGFAHGSGTSFGGVGFDEKLNERMTAAAGVPSITMSTAVASALKKIGAKRVSVASPFHQKRMLERFAIFLEGNGFEVQTRRNLDLSNHNLVSSQPPSTAYNLIKSIDSTDVDALVLNNPNIRTIEVIDQLERDLKKPVITGTQALMWSCLRTIGISETMPGLGKLFQL